MLFERNENFIIYHRKFYPNVSPTECSRAPQCGELLLNMNVVCDMNEIGGDIKIMIFP